jgi:dolichyl-phosphate-mannose--protein O-mannosyl transferase
MVGSSSAESMRLFLTRLMALVFVVFCFGVIRKKKRSKTAFMLYILTFLFLETNTTSSRFIMDIEASKLFLSCGSFRRI